MPQNTCLASVWEEAALLEEPILIEVDTRVIRDLVILAATALQIATGSSQSRETLPDAPMYQTADSSPQRAAVREVAS